MRKQQYKYIIVPRDQYSNEVLARHLSETAALAGNETIFRHDNKEKRGYFIAHELITQLKKSTDSRLRYELFEQVGGGAIKPYGIPQKKPSAAVKKTAESLRKLKKKK